MSFERVPNKRREWKTRTILSRGLCLGLMAAVLALPVQAADKKTSFEDIAPEAATGRAEKAAVQAQKYMVAAAHPLAAQAGSAILARGGSAIDAAITVQLILNLVEPQSSGIGGGGLMLVWDKKTGALRAFDGRETAPAGVDTRLFYGPSGKRKFIDAVVGGASVGVPGALRLLEKVHKEYGKLPWRDLFQPAIEMAEKGFPMSPRLNELLNEEKYLLDNPQARDVFLTFSGAVKPVGEPVVNARLAQTFRVIAEKGADAFYTGEIAQNIVRAVTGAFNPGHMTQEDLAKYEAKERTPLCAPYREYKVCTTPPPSSAVSVLQVLGILQHYDLASLAPNSPEAIHLVSSAMALAYADRDYYVGDSDFVPVPLAGLIDTAYLRGRAEKISRTKALGVAEPGEPPLRQGFYGRDNSPELPCTTHMAIVDADGNAVSFTTTIENVFGSRQMANGFILNNQLTDFAVDAEENGRPIANRIQPGKRPRSSMAPTIVFDAAGVPRLVVGSPGGARILGYVTQTLLGVLDWRMNIQDAISAPHFLSRNAGVELEKGTQLAGRKSDLTSLGHTVQVNELTSGLHGIEITPKGLIGGADPRREGAVSGL